MNGFSTLEYHVLLALAGGPLYGYAIKDAVAKESSGTLMPRAGSLYRVLARLMAQKLVREVEPKDDVPAHPGHARKYYALTASARAELLVETRRLKTAAALAEKRLAAPSRS